MVPQQPCAAAVAARISLNSCGAYGRRVQHTWLPPHLAWQVLRVELVRKQTMMFYQPTKDRLFLKIVLATPNLVATCRSGWGHGPGQHGEAGGSGRLVDIAALAC